MYKIVIQTQQPTIRTKSHILNTINLKKEQGISQKQAVIQVQKEKQNQQINGQLHLLRNLSVGINQLASKMKSCALLVLNPSKDIHHFIKQRQMQIQCINYIKNKITLIENSKIKEEQKTEQLSVIFPIIIFKSIAIAEQLFNFINFSSNSPKDKLVSLAFYIQNLIIVEVDSIIQNWPQLLKDQITGKEVWVEIPHCFQCLSILQAEVTGFYLPKNINNEAPIRKPSQRKNIKKQNQKIVCKVCWIRSKQQSHCHQCQQIEDNWVCMICGTIGCGRYKNADAYKHYDGSKHILSLDLQTDRIWNYKFDCFSHRIQHILEDNMMSQSSMNKEENQKLDNEQMEMQFWKYCSVVSEQLEHQRNFYNKIKNEEIDRCNSEQKLLEERIKKMQEDKQQKKEQLKKKIKKNKKMSKRVNELHQECDQERLLNKHLQQSIKNIGNKIENETIKKRKQQLRKIQQQIEQILITLSQS